MKIVEIEEKPVEKIEKIGNRKTVTEFPDNGRIKESSDFAEKHKTILERVRAIMRCDKYARKNYLWLLLVYYTKCNMISIKAVLEDFYKASSPESINRCRRELYKKAKKGSPELKWLLTDEEFLEETEKMQELFREYYSNQKYQDKAEIIKN